MRAATYLPGLVAALAAWPLAAVTLTFGHGFNFIGPDRTSRVLTRIETDEWSREELDQLSLQLADDAREEKGGDREARLTALAQVRTVLSGRNRPVSVFLAGCWPGRLTCAAWDGSTEPPTLVALDSDLAFIVRLGMDGGIRMVSRIDPGSGSWVAASDPALDWNQLYPFLHEDGPRSLVVDAEGVISFTTRLNRIYQIVRDGWLRRIGEWPRPETEDRLGWLGPVRLDTSTLALGPKGTLFLADTRGHMVHLLAPETDGTVKAIPIAGTGEAAESTPAREAEDARKASLTPVGLAFAGGSLYYVENADNRVRRLTPEDGAWRLSTVAETDGEVVGAFLAGWPDLRSLSLRKLSAGPDGRIHVMENHDRITRRRPPVLQASVDDPIPGFHGPSLSHHVQWLAPVPGGLLAVDHLSRIVLIPFLEPAEPLAELVAAGRKARAGGDTKAFEEIRRQLASWRDARQPLRKFYSGEKRSPLGNPGLPDDLLAMVEDYYWDPSLTWRAGLALRDLDAEDEVSGP